MALHCKNIFFVKHPCFIIPSYITQVENIVEFLFLIYSLNAIKITILAHNKT